MARMVRIRNLHRYQHYRQRNPPWIKWHRACLDDPDFYGLSAGCKWFAVGMVLACSADTNGTLAAPSFLAKRTGVTRKQAARYLRKLLDIGFLEEVASNPLASCKQSASKTLLPVREETEKRREREQFETVLNHEHVDHRGDAKAALSLIRSQIQTPEEDESA